jgi:hypothetical protein
VKILFLLSFFFVKTALAQSIPVICTDTFINVGESSTKMTLRAEAVDAYTLKNISIDNKTKGDKLKTDLFVLKNYTEMGVEVAVGSLHADHFQITSAAGPNPKTDYNVILSFGTKWFETLQGRYGIAVGEIQFYCDDCGGGAPSFNPNLYCRKDTSIGH